MTGVVCMLNMSINAVNYLVMKILVVKFHVLSDCTMMLQYDSGDDENYRLKIWT